MDFAKIVARSLNISWKYKMLWILGFFASFMGGSNVFIGKEHETRAGDFIIQNPWLLAIIIAYLILLFLFFLIMHLICSAGLIKSVADLDENYPPKARESFKSGMVYFWKFLALWVMAIAVAIALFAMIALPIALAFWASVAFGFIFLVLLIPPGLAALFLFLSIYSLAQREIVLGKRGLLEAISQAYRLWRENIGQALVVFLIQLLAGLIMFSLNTFLLLIFAIPLILLAIQSISIVVALLLVEIPMLILFSILLTGFFGTFVNSLYTLFYMELELLRPSSGPNAMPTGNIAGSLT